jgi:NAD(P)-dependent dehydrogenase (short-subunit alcohol dehydrogenase family)
MFSGTHTLTAVCRGLDESSGGGRSRYHGHEKLRRKDHLQHPVGRAGWPQDVAEIVTFLLDSKRAGFITGANFVVDGGMTRKMIYEE